MDYNDLKTMNDALEDILMKKKPFDKIKLRAATPP